MKVSVGSIVVYALCVGWFAHALMVEIIKLALADDKASWLFFGVYTFILAIGIVLLVMFVKGAKKYGIRR